MTTALLILLFLWIAVSLIFSLALCWEASRPLPKTDEVSGNATGQAELPHTLVEHNDKKALCVG